MRHLLLAACLAAVPLAASAQEAPAARAAEDAATRAMAEAMAKAQAARAAAPAAEAKPDAPAADPKPPEEAVKDIPAAKRDQIAKLMEKLRLKDSYEAQVSATFKGFNGMMTQDEGNMPKDFQKKMRQGRAAYFQFMRTALAWEKVKDRYTLLYAKHFSEAELTQLLALLERPEAQLLVRKQLELATDGEHGLSKVQWDVFQEKAKEGQKIMMGEVNGEGGVGIEEAEAAAEAPQK